MIQIIPAIDVIDGKCVRLTQGDFLQKKIYNTNPVDVAKEFESFGLKRLHLVDLDGAKNGKIQNIKTLEQIASKTNMVIDFGGGVKSDSDFHSVINAGASMVAVGSMAVKSPHTVNNWCAIFGVNKILLGADVRNYLIAINGWVNQTDLSIFTLIDQYLVLGINNVFCTDISKDGLLSGPSFKLYEDILLKFPDLNLIASGGVSSIEDVDKLNTIGCKGVIIGKAFYENKILFSEISSYVS